MIAPPWSYNKNDPVNSKHYFKQWTCPYCRMKFNKIAGIGPNKEFCSKKCYTRYRNDLKKRR